MGGVVLSQTSVFRTPTVREDRISWFENGHLPRQRFQSNRVKKGCWVADRTERLESLHGEG